MRILLVEDEELVAEYLKRSLKKGGHEVDYASDGDQAYQKASTKSYDVIILDIILPKRTGLDVCQQIRSEGVRTPIIILSSLDSEKSRVEGLDAGADDYMVKPFSYLELEARLRAVYRRPATLVEDTITFGDLALSSNRHELFYKGEEITLRSKEFAVLEYLMRNSDRAVSRDELLTNIWGISPENASNRVDVCIKELRNKISDDLIKTVPKVGYRLSEITTNELNMK